jgi:hypothetical protein
MKNNIFNKLVVKKLESDENRTEIKLCINNDTELYNSFSNIKNGYGKINDDVIDYLKNETEDIPKRHGVIITLELCEKTSEKMEIIEKLIKTKIEEKIRKVNEKVKKINRNSCILALLGMILIGATQVFQTLEKRYAFNELIIVMSWVFMWKAVELFFFERVSLIKEKAILMKIYYSKVN